MDSINTIEILEYTKCKFLKYLEIAKINYLNNSAYLVNLISRSGIVIIRIWIFTQLYKVTYSVSGTNIIGDLTLPMVIWSLMLTQSFQIATKPMVSKLIEEEVKLGTLAYSLNKPYSYLLFNYFGFLGRTFVNNSSNLILGTVAALLLVGPINFSAKSIILGLFLLFFGYTIDFFISFTIGVSAFWIEDISAFMWIYSKGQMVLGGLILPLSLFPDSLRKIAEILPFSQLYYGAARTMVNFDWALFQKFFLVQLAWVVFFGIVSYYIFHKGIKKISINGG